MSGGVGLALPLKVPEVPFRYGQGTSGTLGTFTR